MAKKIIKGKFITFEGSEGCGKSTQARLLCNYLKQQGAQVIRLREPGATKIGEKIRDMILDCRNNSITPESETLLYMAARVQIVTEKIKPALKKGITVICDRFLDSTLAYQGYGLGVDKKVIEYLGKFVTAGIEPDLTIFLDLPPREGLRRVGKRRDRIESRPLAYHQRVRGGYLKLAKRYPERFRIIKLQDDRHKTQDKIRQLVERCLLEK